MFILTRTDLLQLTRVEIFIVFSIVEVSVDIFCRDLPILPTFIFTLVETNVHNNLRELKYM